MKKIITRICTIVLTISILTTFLCVPALAANGNVYFSDPSTTVGSTVYVSLSIGDSVASYSLGLEYDSSKLEYIGASSSELLTSSGGGGYINLWEYNATSAGTFNVTLTFNAIAAGSAAISVSYYEMVDNNGDPVAGHIGSSTVTISNPATASSDTTLSSLYISPGSLYPSFSPDTTYYSTTVSASTSKLTVSAEANDDNAEVYVYGTNLSVGTNYVTVTVVAEDGSEDYYTIEVTRPASTVSNENESGVPETDIPEAPTEAYVTLVTGQILPVSEVIDERSVPNGFELTETIIEGFPVDAISYGENKDLAVWLIDENELFTGFYFINEQGLGYPMVTLHQPDGGIIMTSIASTTSPAGYTVGKFTIDGMEHNVFVPDNGKEPDHCLFYGINSEGKTELYCYDPLENTYQRYGLSSVVEIKEIEVTPSPEKPETDTKPETDVPSSPADTEITLKTLLKNKTFFWVAVIGIVVVLALIALCIVLGIMYLRKSKACRAMAAKRNFTTVSEE